jgi:glyoxylase-like metal-dependent hydrolase (beta-lactamase superfamily II)
MIKGTVGLRPLQLYLLLGDQRAVLLDTGCAPDPERFVFPYLKTIGLSPHSIDLVINTHPDLDHSGGNHAMKTANPRVLLSCGDADRGLIEDPQVMWNRRYNAFAERHGLQYDDTTRAWIFEMLGAAQKVDFTWAGGETLRLGEDWLVEILHTPGHSAGHLSVFDPRSGTLLSGDAVQGSVYLDIFGIPALCPTYLNVDTYLFTIRYLESLRLKQLATCHWPLMNGSDINSFLAESRRFTILAETLVLEELHTREAGATLAQLISAIGAKLGSWPRSVDPELMYALAGTMQRLRALGKVDEWEVEHRTVYKANAF